MPVRLYKEQNFIRLNLYRYLFGKLAVIALGFLIISSLPYLLFIHYQKPNDIAFYKGAVPEPGIDMLTFPQPTEVVTAGLQAKPIPSLDVDSSTHVSQRTDESSQPIVEPKAQEMIVATKTIPVETKEASRKASQYKTIRITPIRQEPHFASAVTKDIDAGTVVTVFEIEGDWLKIKTGSTDSGGYVRKEYVVPVS